MKKLISTLTLAVLMLSMTTFALAAPATQNSSCTGFSVVTGSGCTQSGNDSSTGSSTCSIYDYLKSLGINCGSSATQDSTSNSNCSASNDASDTSGSDTTYGTPSCNTASNAAGTQQTTAPQESSTNPSSDARASDTTPSETTSPVTTASTANTSDTAVEAASDNSSTCNGNTCIANSTCVGGTCTADNSSTGGSCTSDSTCAGGSCAADSSDNSVSCSIGTTYSVNCANSSSYGSTLSELLASLHQQCGGVVSQLNDYLKNCTGQTVTDTSDDTSVATPVPSSNSGTTPDVGTTPDAGTTPDTGTTPDSGTTPTDNTGSGTTPSDNSANLSYEEQVAVLVNEQRAANGLDPLTFSADLSNMARAKSQDMHDNNYFSHTSPTYGSPFDMMKTFGISYRTAGENIAMGYATPEEVVNAWMNSAGHRANILNSAYTEIGVGYVADGNYWTQEFIG